jgi:hypothetical protein
VKACFERERVSSPSVALRLRRLHIQCCRIHTVERALTTDDAQVALPFAFGRVRVSGEPETEREAVSRRLVRSVRTTGISFHLRRQENTGIPTISPMLGHRWRNPSLSPVIPRRHFGSALLAGQTVLGSSSAAGRTVQNCRCRAIRKSGLTSVPDRTVAGTVKEWRGKAVTCS